MNDPAQKDRADNIRWRQARDLICHVLTRYEFFEWEKDPVYGPFIYLPPARKAVREKFEYLPTKKQLIAAFTRKEEQVASIVENERVEDERRYYKGLPLSKTTFDPHDEDHRARFKIAYRTWCCQCWPPNGW